MSENPIDQISHDGIIQKINEDSMDISIISMAACVSCHAKGACSASDMKEKIVPVKPIQGKDYHVGDQVTITIKQSVGTWAVLLGYVFPLIIVVASLIILSNIMNDEGIAGLISLLILAPYYLVLYVSRKKMADNFEFKLLN